jgi:ATP-dependent Zn protease
MVEQFETTEEILKDNKSLLSEIAESLLQHKEISGEIMNYFKNKVNNPILSIKQKHVRENNILHKE